MPTTTLVTYPIANRGPGRVTTATVVAPSSPNQRARIDVTLDLTDAVFNDPAVSFWYGLEVQDASQAQAQAASASTPGMVAGWRWRFGAMFAGGPQTDRAGNPSTVRPNFNFYLKEIAGLTSRLVFDPMGTVVAAGAVITRIT